MSANKAILFAILKGLAVSILTGALCVSALGCLEVKITEERRVEKPSCPLPTCCNGQE